MSRLETLQSAEAFVAGRALPAAMVCHRRLLPDPMAVCLFSLGAEPFSAAAIQWGRAADQFDRSVAGDPRNRDLAFTALLPFARAFNAYFETAWGMRSTTTTPRGREVTQVPELPQIVVPNRESVLLLGRLGRRLRFVSDAPEELLRLGAHLAFLREHAATAGRQLVLAATDLNDGHFHMPLSDWERGSLAAQDAAVDPPAGIVGHTAAAHVGIVPIGPRPDAEQDARLRPLLTRFGRQRAGNADPAVVTPLLAPIDAHYEALLMPAWELSWRTVERLRDLREARMVQRRIGTDQEAYVKHMDLMDRAIRRRTRQTVAQAIALRASWEDAASRVRAQEAYDDPLKMVDVLLAAQGFIGTVIGFDGEHRVQGPKQMVRRPRVELALHGPCPLLPGDTVHWDADPDRDYIISAVAPRPGHGDLVTLLLQNPGAPFVPTVGDEMCVAIMGVAERWRGTSDSAEPWPYQAPPVSTMDDLDQEVA
jgi:hypothetical protein